MPATWCCSGWGVIEVTIVNRNKAQQQIKRECHGWQSIRVGQVLTHRTPRRKPTDSWAKTYTSTVFTVALGDLCSCTARSAFISTLFCRSRRSSVAGRSNSAFFARVFVEGEAATVQRFQRQLPGFFGSVGPQLRRNMAGTTGRRTETSSNINVAIRGFMFDVLASGFGAMNTGYSRLWTAEIIALDSGYRRFDRDHPFVAVDGGAQGERLMQQSIYPTRLQCSACVVTSSSRLCSTWNEPRSRSSPDGCESVARKSWFAAFKTLERRFPGLAGLPLQTIEHSPAIVAGLDARTQKPTVVPGQALGLP